MAAGDEAPRTPEEQSETNVPPEELEAAVFYDMYPWMIGDTDVGQQQPDPIIMPAFDWRQRRETALERNRRQRRETELERYWISNNGTRSELNIQTLGNLLYTTRNILLQDNNKSNDNKWNGEMTLPLLAYKSIVCMLNKDEEVDKPFSPGKHMKTAQCVLSFLIATIVFLWILTDVCSLLSIIKLQPEHGPLFIWFSLLEPVGFMLFVCAVAAMIVIGAPFSRLLSAILLFWGIWLLIRSSKSLTALCLPILGILLMVWHLCMWKRSCQMKGNEQGSEAPKIKPMCFTFAVHAASRWLMYLF